MEKYQFDIIEEQKELSIKIEKLKYFINDDPRFETLRQIERINLREQHDYMVRYDNILLKRIKEFPYSIKE